MLKFFCYSTCAYNRNLNFSSVALPSSSVYPLRMPKPLPNSTLSLQVFQAMSDGGQLKVYSLLTRPQHHPSSCLLGAKTTHIGTRGCAFVPSLHQQGRRRPTVFRRMKTAAAAKHFIPGPSNHPAVNFVGEVFTTSPQALWLRSPVYKIFGSTKLGATVDGRPSSMTASLGEVSSHIVAESAQKLQSFQTQQQQAPWLLFGLCICLSAAAGYIAPHLVNSSPPALAEALVKPSSVIPTTPPTTVSSRPTDNEISHGKKVHTEYTITGVPGDGRCLFRAVAHGACLRSGKPAPDESTQRSMADELRNKAIDELVKRRETTEWFIEGDFDTYVKRMRQPHIWGGEPELLMLADVLEMPITVYMKEKGGIIAIAEYGQEYGADNPIQVLYHGFGHYEALQIPDDRPPTSKL